MPEAVSTALEVLGLALIIAAAFVAHTALGLLVLGAVLVGVGYLAGRPRPEVRP